jgi:transmembrane sensor
MTEPERDALDRDRLMADAAAWFARMRGPDAEASRGPFETWLARDARHRSAYNRAAEVFAMGKLLRDEPAAGAVAVRTSRTRQRLPLVAATIGALCILVIASWSALPPATGWHPGDQVANTSTGYQGDIVDIATAPGETRTVRLADGSVLDLGADTRIAADLSAEVRRLTLERGRARFRVAHEQRPFIVHAGGGAVTARGTIFEVALAAGRKVSVRLIEGTVDVVLPEPAPAPAQAARPAVRRLLAGETLSFTGAIGQGGKGHFSSRRGGSQPSASAVRIAHDYDAVPISELIAEANRDGPREIRVLDPAIGALRVSGRFAIDNPDLLAERIAALFDLAVDRRDSTVIFLKAK